MTTEPIISIVQMWKIRLRDESTKWQWQDLWLQVRAFVGGTNRTLGIGLFSNVILSDASP